jgi:hypothetical protein
MKRFIFLLFGTAFAVTVSAQSIYYCTKNGKKIVTDQPCENHGASQSKRVDYQEMPPLTITQGLTDSEKRKGQALTERLNREDRQYLQAKKYEQAKLQSQKSNNERVCSELWRYKEQIVSHLRYRSTDYWNSEHRRVNDEIYRRECGK